MLYSENINKDSLVVNNKKARLGVASQVDIEKDLPRKPDYSVDSFFIIGRVESEGHKINYLYHIMAMNMPLPIEKLAKKWQVCYSLLDETTGYYVAGDHIYTDNEVRASKDHFSIVAPNAKMEGTWDNMEIYLKEKDFEINTTTHAIHYPVITRGSAVFDLFGMVIHQFSIPYMKTEGILTIKGKEYKLNGENAVSWFDCQWQKQNFKLTTEWSWMAIYLDNGEVISILDSVGETDTPRFMTVLRTDGSLEHATDAKAFSECELRHWKSEVSGQDYGTEWNLEMPSFNSKLHVLPIVEKQEIPSSMKKLCKYEGSAKVEGTFEGKQVAGRATVEIIKI